MDDVTLISPGCPTLTEIRERAIVDYTRSGRHFGGQVEVTVRATVRSVKYLCPALAYLEATNVVIRAAVKAGVLDNKDQVVGWHFHNPIVDGLDCLYVSLRPVSDRALLLV